MVRGTQVGCRFRVLGMRAVLDLPGHQGIAREEEPGQGSERRVIRSYGRVTGMLGRSAGHREMLYAFAWGRIRTTRGYTGLDAYCHPRRTSTHKQSALLLSCQRPD